MSGIVWDIAHMSVQGIDVSYCQRRVNWPEVAREKSFVFARCGWGSSPDDMFVRHATGAAEAGLYVAPYVFALGRESVDAQLDALACAHDLCGEKRLPPAIDFEQLTEKGCRDTRSFCRSMILGAVALFGHVIVYTGAGWWGPFGDESTDTSGASLWVAHYGVSRPMLPKPWKSWAFWQYKGDEGRATGVDGPCDLNVFSGDEKALAELSELACLRLASGASPKSRLVDGLLHERLKVSGCFDAEA